MSGRRVVPLLEAKLAIPPLRRSSVLRARLHAPLLHSAETPLTVVVAPAGWGKTTLLSQWAHDPAECRGIAWLSLDRADDEPLRFWSYVLSALRRGVPALTGDPLAALSAPGAEPVDLALPTLLNELSALDSEHVLVLDDFHLLTHPAIHAGIEFLLSYLPPALRLVIAGRSDPPLPLARMRARGELTEVRAADLGFTLDEAAALMTAVAGTPFDAAGVAPLWGRTEGWAAGLHLTALRVRHSGEPTSATEEVRGDERHILDYLSLEVIDRLPADHRDLLERTSVLERVSGSLCDEVLGRQGSAAVLESLDRANVFVVPVDPQREWYRCHPLLRDVLSRRLTRTDAHAGAPVLARAADWFLARDHVTEAVDLRIRAGDSPAAAGLLRSRVAWFLERGAAATVLGLGRRLPAPVVLGDPGLCVALAWAAGFGGRYALMGPWLDAAEPLIREDSAPLPGWRTLQGAASTMRARVLDTAGADPVAASAEAAVAVALEDDPMVLGYFVTRTVLGIALNDAGRPEEALPHLTAAWERAQVIGLPPLLGLQAVSALAWALLETGRLERLRRLLAARAPAVEAARGRRDDTAGPGLARLWMVQGRLAHRDGDDDAAGGLLERAVELARAFGEPSALVAALTSLAEVQAGRQETAAAQQALAEARDVVRASPVVPLFVERLTATERRTGRAAAPAGRADGAPVEPLTDRERAVLRALTGSATQREIGAALYLSINTVKGYTKSVYRKLGVATRQDAVQRARRLGLL
ncbi:LuxR C-terminal-related transcriptional regulator [Geodermatophilus sp. CPCC 206100]|uniref:LuxR C-terminal-related transcriptional regulator n=1 Tax=Geodermatophilus sp. CPCC 206100 TaxID=3020054 RepID=UPI003AFF8483